MQSEIALLSLHLLFTQVPQLDHEAGMSLTCSVRAKKNVLNIIQKRIIE